MLRFLLLFLFINNIKAQEISKACLIPEGRSVKSTEKGLTFQWEERMKTLQPHQKKEFQELMAQIYRIFQKEFSYKKISAPMRIRIFGKKRVFQRCLRAMRKKSNGAPFYSPKLDRIFMFKNRNTPWKRTLKTLLHEGTHFIFNKEILGKAIIFNEGLAVFMSNLKWRPGKTGVFIEGHPRFENVLKNSRGLYSLDHFFRLSNREWQKTPKVSYPQSYSLVYFLKDTSPDTLKKVINYLKTPPRQRATYHKFFQKNYPGGMRSLEGQWKAWIRRPRKQINF